MPSMPTIADPIRESAEAAVHETIRATLQKCFNDYGLLVHSVSVDWIDLPRIGKHDAICNAVSLHTTYRKS